jgi:hypothetical protein
MSTGRRMITHATAVSLVRVHRYALRAGNRAAATEANRLIVQYIDQHPASVQTAVIFALMEQVLSFTSAQT